MAKKCFLSFHYEPDSWRVSQIKQMGVIEGQPVLAANKWEEVKKKGEAAIKEWIANNMKGKDCLVVLVGKDTAGRQWVKHEIKEAWNAGKGVFGIYIHNLKDANQNKTTKGSDPFASFTVAKKPLTSYAKMYNPPFTDSSDVYNYIKANMDSWVEMAIKIRKTA
jgi:hypothetical protein